MIRKLNKNLSLKNSGFTLAEAIFSLFITILILSILQNLLLSIRRANLNENMHVNELTYAYVQLNNFIHAPDTKNVYPIDKDANSKNTAFARVDKKGNKEVYRLTYYAKNKVLRAQKTTGGYMPLLFNVEDAKFETRKDQIIIRVVEEKKGKSELVFQLDEKPDNDEKITTNKKKKSKSKRAA